MSIAIVMPAEVMSEIALVGVCKNRRDISCEASLYHRAIATSVSASATSYGIFEVIQSCRFSHATISPCVFFLQSMEADACDSTLSTGYSASQLIHNAALRQQDFIFYSTQ